jgi:hypothetical protein
LDAAHELLGGLAVGAPADDQFSDLDPGASTIRVAS